MCDREAVNPSLSCSLALLLVLFRQVSPSNHSQCLILFALLSLVLSGHIQSGGFSDVLAGALLGTGLGCAALALNTFLLR
jgi:hypothetical protein